MELVVLVSPPSKAQSKLLLGVIAATANNNVCVVGAAHDAKFGGVRMLDGDVTDEVEAKSLQ